MNESEFHASFNTTKIPLFIKNI